MLIGQISCAQHSVNILLRAVLYSYIKLRCGGDGGVKESFIRNETGGN